MSIKAAIFDLDDTLIYTKNIKRWFFDFLSNYGLTEEKIRFIYNATMSENGENKFTWERFRSKVEENVDVVCDWDKTYFDFEGVFSDILVKGAKKTLNFLQEKKVPLYIVTLGTPDWQNKKIKLAGLEDFFSMENIRYTVLEEGGKKMEIKKIIKEYNVNDGEDIVFFNDKPDETLEILNYFTKMFACIRREKEFAKYKDEDFEELNKNKRVLKISEQFNFLEIIKELL